jgi:hypothetical protein
MLLMYSLLPWMIMYDDDHAGVISFEVKGDGNPWSQETFDATARSVSYF